MKSENKKLIVVLGPTATGKTKLAVNLASKFNGEIISADSRQVYRGMDIGTGKDLAEYRLQGQIRAPKGRSGRPTRGSKSPLEVPYHLIDIINPKTPFNVAKYQKLAYKAIETVQKQEKTPFLVGGTGLYIDAVVNGMEFASPVEGGRKKLDAIRKRLDKLSLAQLLSRLKKIDPATFKIIDQKNRRRVQRALEIFYETGIKKSGQKMSKPDLDILVLGIGLPMDEIYKKIDKRLSDRIDEGMIQEIKKLRKGGVSWKRLDEFGLEYRYVSRYLRGMITYNEMIEQLRNAIHHFAKRQMTWFKRNKKIVWIKNITQAQKEIKKFIKK